MNCRLIKKAAIFLWILKQLTRAIENWLQVFMYLCNIKKIISAALFMKILVTGSKGQLGREMQRMLERFIPGSNTYIDIEQLDLTDPQAVEKFIAEGEYTHIVNCAAYTAVDKAEADQTDCYAVNAEAVRNLATAASKFGMKVVHISTDYVFDGHSCRPYKESDKVNPMSHYGTSKRKGEMVLLSLCPDAIIIRTAWLYSPHGNNFVKTMLRLGREQKEIRVVSDQVGTPTLASDLAEAIVTILRSRQWVPGIFHFTDEGVCSWYDFAKAIFRYGGIKNCKVVPISTEDYPTAATRPPYSVLDKTAIKKTYNIEIPHWEESLALCLAQMSAGVL